MAADVSVPAAALLAGDGAAHVGPPGAATATVGHPLLGAKLRCASQDTIFEAQLSTAQLPYLADHRVYDHAILPAAAYLEMAVAAASRVLGSPQVALEKVRISEPLFVTDEPTTVQVIVSPGSETTFTIVSLKGDDAWTVHATGQCSRLDEGPAQVAGPVLCQRPAPVALTGLLDPGAQPGVAAELAGAWKRPMSPISLAIV